MRYTRKTLVAGAIVTSLALTACGGDGEGAGDSAEALSGKTCADFDLSSPPAEPVPIRIGHGDQTDAPLFVQFLAHEEAELDHYGRWYTLDAQQFAPPDRLAAYQAGALDAGTAAAPQLLSGIEQGLDIAAVASLATIIDDGGETYAYSYLALENSGIDGPEDLKGKKIGIIAPNTSTEYWAIAALQSAGLDARDAELVSVPPPTAEEALRSGQVDVQFFSDVFYALATQKGGLVEVFDGLTGPGFDQEFLSIWFDKGFVADNPEAYCAWVADYQKAMQFYLDERQAALRVLIEEGYDSAPSVDAALARKGPGRKADGRINEENFQKLIDNSVETGFMDLTISTDDVFLDGFSLTE